MDGLVGLPRTNLLDPYKIVSHSADWLLASHLPSRENPGRTTVNFIIIIIITFVCEILRCPHRRCSLCLFFPLWKRGRFVWSFKTHPLGGLRTFCENRWSRLLALSLPLVFCIFLRSPCHTPRVINPMRSQRKRGPRKKPSGLALSSRALKRAPPAVLNGVGGTYGVRRRGAWPWGSGMQNVQHDGGFWNGIFIC